jgi:indolepyruvate ferredoxin oxidoreductase beta subunit
MSQRGGSVTSDVRFGGEVLSPMVPHGEADFAVVLAEGEADAVRPMLRPGGILLEPGFVPAASLPSSRSLNVALLGALSTWLDLPDEAWEAAMQAALPRHLDEVNARAFRLGRDAALAARATR